MILKAHRLLNGIEAFGIARQARYGTFEQRRDRQTYALCDLKEQYVVSTQDNIIGRVLFDVGEFDFNKFEIAHQAIVANTGKRPKTLIDIGANIGTICIPAVARGLVKNAIAIEPSPENCRLLRANIELNDLHGRIMVHETAVGPRDGEILSLALSPDNLGDHRIATGIASSEGEGRQIIKVRSDTLDHVLEDLRDQNLLLWMDVQGFEGFVLAGSRNLLEDKPPLVMEFWPRGMPRESSFQLVKTAIGHYVNFIDLAHPDRLRPIGDLDLLYDEIGQGEDPPRMQDFTDILIV
jgi:FkbM family methyltransferase